MTSWPLPLSLTLIEVYEEGGPTRWSKETTSPVLPPCQPRRIRTIAPSRLSVTMFTFHPSGVVSAMWFVERGEGGVVISPRHLAPLHIKQPASAATHAGAVRFFAPRERRAHIAVLAPEEARQPTILNRRLQRRVSTTFVMRGYVFNCLHIDSGRKAV